jgi:peptidoglycan hydrolase-like protein with peptidoglycan-binding domain
MRELKMLKMTRASRLIATGGIAVGAVALAAAPALATVANIGPGSTNVAGVKCVQRSMNLTEAAGLNVDGQYGQHTFSAVVTFQEAHGLSADGIVGPNTGHAIIGQIDTEITKIHQTGGDTAPYTTWLSQCSNQIPNG